MSKRLPPQEQTLTGTFEYEFTLDSLLNAGDSIASVDWEIPTGLTLINSIVNGTTVTAFIAGDVGATLYQSYWVGFTINSVGNPTPVSPTLSFEITLVKRILVKVI